ncbi:MAG: class I SAM-dependent methyltransferase, partial [Candidatus Dormibacteraceae bacterium]
ARVCDIGCGLDARFLQSVRERVRWGVGIDYQLSAPAATGTPVVRGDITRGLPFRNCQFDHAVLLAVLEHLSDPQPLFVEIFRILAPGGSLIMTWPQAAIDPCLNVLHRAGLVSREMESEKHQARVPLPTLLSVLSEVGFRCPQHQRFEFGLNNLLVCYKPR